MASSSSSSSLPTGSPSSSPTLLLPPSRNPLPLSASQESQVRELYHKRVRTKCADQVRGTSNPFPFPFHFSKPKKKEPPSLTPQDFAACATNRTFTATFMCRPEQKAMNSCMKLFATREEQDLAREEWFAGLERRAEERAEKERRREKDERFWRDWWDKEKSTRELGGEK